MICIVMKPVRSPVVKGEGLYDAVFCGERFSPEPLRVRARNAAEAERKLMICFRHELPGRTLSFDPEDFREYDKEEKENGMQEGLPPSLPEGGGDVPVLQEAQT